MSKRLGILRLQLLSHAIHALREYYADVLELDVEEQPEGISVRAGTTHIIFRLADPDSPSPIYHVAFNIPENKFKQAKDWLSLRTRLLSIKGQDEFDFRDWNAHALYFKDPAGNILELIARHDLDNASSGPFTPADILCASEIGLPVGNVAAAAAEIESRLGLPHYRPAADDFAPMGDEHALLIVIREGRIWMPTSTEQAQAFPLQADLQGERPARLQLSGAPFQIATVQSSN